VSFWARRAVMSLNVEYPTTAASDLDAAAARGFHYEHLDQLALEHLLGARSGE
jgi:hypothetical protein